MARRVLVVDDDADLLSLLTVAFTIAGGWEVLGADGVAAAAEHLDAAEVDVIVTDGELGDGSGHDVLASSGDTPVVLLSGSVDGPADTLLPQPPFAAAVAKPFNPLTLAELVGTLVDGGRS